VYDLNPTGNLKIGELITVLYYGPTPTIAPPAAPTLSPAVAGNIVLAGDPFTIAWSVYNQCPAGSPLVSYTINVSGGESRTVGAGATSEPFTAPSAPGTSASITMQVLCGELPSVAGGALTINID
jgi:serine/threonine-protein kinase